MVAPGQPFTLILTADTGDPLDGETALAAAEARDRELLAVAGIADRDSSAGRLVLGADAFIVRRDIAGVQDGRTVIAGYPWFNDWGRDTMIALPGLCLATGRHAEAATMLRTFARFVRDGLIPNDFPDDAGAGARLPHDRCVAVVRPGARARTGARPATDGLVDELLPTIRAIIDHQLAGTRYGIGATRPTASCAAAPTASS